MIHIEATLNDSIRMELLGVFRGEAERSVEFIGRNGVFYATTLKCLKRELGNPNIVTNLKLN